MKMIIIGIIVFILYPKAHKIIGKIFDEELNKLGW